MRTSGPGPGCGSRRPLGGLLLIGVDIYVAVVTYIPQYRVRNDFRLIYGAALTGLHQGYGHLYDLAAQKQAVEGLGAGFYWSPS